MTAPDTSPRWQPLEAIDRRVLGVLIEKGKTTPDSYPLSLNGLKTGCNQKSNRFPQMQLAEEDVEEAIDRLRAVGGVAVIQGSSRIDKYRHLAYEWLGVDKVEIAVMAELLLRGAQTIGELRGRAARMEPIPSLAELQPVLARLVAKNLVVYLTPPGRGAIVTHNLYIHREIEKLRREHGAGSAAESATQPESGSDPSPSPNSDPAPSQAQHQPAASTASRSSKCGIDAIRTDVEELKRDMARLRETLGDLQRGFDALREDLGA